MKNTAIVFFLLLVISAISIITINKLGHVPERKLASGETPGTHSESDSNEDIPHTQLIWLADFESLDTGFFNFKDIKHEFGSYGFKLGSNMAGVGVLKFRTPGLKNDENITIVEEAGNKFMRTWFKGGHFGIIDQDHRIGSGHIFHPRIPGKFQEIWISQNIRWPHDRDWGLSGNMGVTVTGGSSPPKCNPYQINKHNGFVLNLMWSKHRELKLYLYWPGKSDSVTPCGISGPFKWEDPNKPGSRLLVTDYSDSWHNVTLRIVLNDKYIAGEGNGIIEGFWDGKLAFSVDTLRLRTESGVYIDHARSQLNHGGNDDRFAPEKDTYIDVDDVWTWTWKEDSGLPSGFTPWNEDEMVPLPNFPKND